MYTADTKQYIFKQSSGTTWNFFHDNRLGFCYSTLTPRNTWATPVPLIKNAHQSFYVDMDYKDHFHILTQDREGNILYTSLVGESEKTITILKSKSPSVYDKHLHLIYTNENIYFFYVLQHNESLILAYQTLGNGKISNPRVIDYVVKSTLPYSVIYDKSESIYAFYQLSDGSHLQIGYKKLILLQNFWGEFTPVSRFNGDCELPVTVIDNKSIIHICYQRRSARQYELIYQQKILDKNIWTQEFAIHSSGYPFTNSSIICTEENIIIYWIRDDVIYFSSSTDSGNTWSKPARYNFYVGRQLMCLSYKSNTPYESGKISARDIPGSFINGLKLAFYQSVSESTKNLTADELRNMIVDSLNMLKGSIEELKQSVSRLRDDLSGVEFSNQSLEKELIKCTVKQELIEAQLAQYKMNTSRLESYKEELNELKANLVRQHEQKADITSDAKAKEIKLKRRQNRGRFSKKDKK